MEVDDLQCIVSGQVDHVSLITSYRKLFLGFGEDTIKLRGRSYVCYGHG